MLEKKSVLTSGLVLVVLLLIVSGCSWFTHSSRFSYAIDAAIKPNPGDRNGRPLEAVRDAAGRTSLFIANEMIVNTSDPAVAAALAAKWGGEVLRSDIVPEPPPGSGIEIAPAARQPTQFLVSVDPGRADLSRFVADVTALGIVGRSTLSSETGAKLLALVTRESRLGAKVSPNFVGTPALVTSTQEHPMEEGFANAYEAAPYQSTGSGSSVVQAWQLLQAHGGFARVGLAIIDGGFWLDAEGRPMSSVTPWVSDLPEAPIQYDFVGDDYLADGPNRAGCCPWHGNGAVGVAAGAHDNRYGGAGTGGLVANPMLFATDLSWDQVARAIRTAGAWGAGVVSMSFAGECDNAFCDSYLEFNLYPALRNARENHVVVVAAAGNAGQSTHAVPCKGDSVICVGALADGTRNAIGYSNFGPELDIWAPTNIPVNPDPVSGGAVASFNGTSASTPFVAGVAAMLKSFDAKLTSDQVKEVFRRTAWQDSRDPKVTHAINAYQALRKVIPDFDAAPDLSIVAPARGSLNRSLPVHTITFDLEEGTGCCTVDWSPAPTSLSGGGRAVAFTFATAGSYEVSATAIDRRGNRGPVRSATLLISNDTPELMILQPTPEIRVSQGQTLQLLGVATDPNEGPGPDSGRLACVHLLWTSDHAADRAFPVSGCDVNVTFASMGRRILTLTATDPQGASTSAQVPVEVLLPTANYAPTVSVRELPAMSRGFHWTQALAVEASAVDPEGNVPLTYRWQVTAFRPNSTSVVYGVLTEVSVSTTSGNLSWTPNEATPSLFGDWSTFGNDCYYGQLIKLELLVTDSRGNATRRILADPRLPSLPTIKVFRCELI